MRAIWDVLFFCGNVGGHGNQDGERREGSVGRHRFNNSSKVSSSSMVRSLTKSHCILKEKRAFRAIGRSSADDSVRERHTIGNVSFSPSLGDSAGIKERKKNHNECVREKSRRESSNPEKGERGERDSNVDGVKDENVYDRRDGLYDNEYKGDDDHNEKEGENRLRVEERGRGLSELSLENLYIATTPRPPNVVSSSRAPSHRNVTLPITMRRKKKTKRSSPRDNPPGAKSHSAPISIPPGFRRCIRQHHHTCSSTNTDASSVADENTSPLVVDNSPFVPPHIFTKQQDGEDESIRGNMRRERAHQQEQIRRQVNSEDEEETVFAVSGLKMKSPLHTTSMIELGVDNRRDSMIGPPPDVASNSMPLHSPR